MQVQINYGDVPLSPALSSHVLERVEHALRFFQRRITRVEVHIRDDKQHRRGADDKRCVIEARIAGRKTLAVSERATDLYGAVSNATEKLRRAVRHRIERQKH